MYAKLIREFNPEDGQFFLIMRKNGRMFAKCFNCADAFLLAQFVYSLPDEVTK